MLDKSTYRELKQKVPIKESHEEMIELDECFIRFSPHPYQSLGAPYNGKSPFYVRKTVLERLHIAYEKLDTIKKGYRLKIFDAYRPLEVQRFMIDYDIKRISLEMYGSKFESLDKNKQELVEKKVSHFWSPISKNIVLSPPPHSTGGALDLTIVDENGIELDMGTEIDALVDASRADYYENTNTIYEINRKLLVDVMNMAGFIQLPTEWWHFSYGDQIWALTQKSKEQTEIYAKYGMI
jgi:zinc D-Ala-D-Ala dipeptidase